MLAESLNNTKESGSRMTEQLQPVKLKEMQEIADTIKNARQAKQLSQKELAGLAGITPVQLCRIENMECRPNRKTLQKISGHIGVPYSELLYSAGYSNMSGSYTLYKKDGNMLDTDSIVESIYRVDSDFLDFFRNFEEIGTTENLELLKSILAAMRKEAKIKDGTQNEEDSVINIFKHTFFALKRYIIATLAPFLHPMLVESPRE